MQDLLKWIILLGKFVKGVLKFVFFVFKGPFYLVKGTYLGMRFMNCRVAHPDYRMMRPVKWLGSSSPARSDYIENTRSDYIEHKGHIYAPIGEYRPWVKAEAQERRRKGLLQVRCAKCGRSWVDLLSQWATYD